jgi:protocatechuate 3,4-dioxygenase beta subunit
MGQATAFPTTSGPIAAAEIDGPAAGAAVETTSAQRDQRCTAPAEPLPSLTEGPYFKAGSPERTSLIEPGTAGEPLTLRGFVFDVECTPLSGAKLDFWQADSNGAYDNAGFQMRGHQFTDAAGAYVLTTVVPGLYPGRTEHIHVKVQPQGGTVLTTQLFFPDVTGNQTDRIFDSRLVIRMQHANNGWAGTFDFIVPGSG